VLRGTGGWVRAGVGFDRFDDIEAPDRVVVVGNVVDAEAADAVDKVDEFDAEDDEADEDEADDDKEAPVEPEIVVCDKGVGEGDPPETKDDKGIGEGDPVAISDDKVDAAVEAFEFAEVLTTNGGTVGVVACETIWSVERVEPVALDVVPFAAAVVEDGTTDGAAAASVVPFEEAAADVVEAWLPDEVVVAAEGVADVVTFEDSMIAIWGADVALVTGFTTLPVSNPLNGSITPLLPCCLFCHA
jgi:hypothetical protein